MHHVTLKRRKKPYNRPRFNVCLNTAPAPELTASELSGTAPEAEFKDMMGRKLAAAAVLGGVMWAKAAPAADLRR